MFNYHPILLMPGAQIQSGKRVSLRTLEREDISFLQRGFTNPEIRYPLGNVVHKNLDQVEERYEDENDLPFLVCIDDDDRSQSDGGVRRIGVVSIRGVSWHRPELAYWLVPDVHGEGYGKEAVSLVIEYVFRVFDTPGVGADTYDFNDASRGLLESLGFAEEGRSRKFRFIDGEHRDLVHYGLLREEWRERIDT